MCFYRTKLYKACGHTEFRRFMCNPVSVSNNDHSNPNSSDHVYIKGRFACGEPPEHVNDLELGPCGHCRRKTRYPNKGEGRRRTVFDKEQSHKRAGDQVFVSESDTDEPCHEGKGPEQPMIQTFMPYDAKDARYDDKTEDFLALPADVVEERRLFKKRVAEAVEECRQFRQEIKEDQTKASSLLDAIGNLCEDRPMSDKSELPALITKEHPTNTKSAETESTFTKPNSVNPRTLSHSATKVRRDLHAARGRVRSMIQAINTKSDASQMIRPINHRSMVTAIVNTINRTRQPDHSPKPQPPVAPKEELPLTKRPLPFPPYPDTRTLSKPAKLQLLAKHRFHRLVPVPEESTSQSLVVANSAANTVVLRRAKAVKVRNLNAFHCPVRQPRFGLKRTVLAPPVPRHSTPPVAVPCSKFADLGRRRVSELEWSFVV